MGWCTVNGRGEECSAMDCDRLEGDWNPRPIGGCLVLSLIDLSWAILVRKSVWAIYGVEGLAQVVGDRVRGGDGPPSGLDLDGAVTAGCLDELPD